MVQKILTGLADKNGKILARSRKDTEAKLGEEKIIANMVASIEEVLAKKKSSSRRYNCSGNWKSRPLRC